MSRLLGVLVGDARLVLVVGDAGVGKTRFVTEGMDRAAAAGMVVVRGECLPLAGTLPLFPVADALGELGRLEGGGLLAAALDAALRQMRAGRSLPHGGRPEPGGLVVREIICVRCRAAGSSPGVRTAGGCCVPAGR